MILTVGCSGYRSFSEPAEFPLGLLTVVFGKNNSGKTTLTRLPLFIAASAIGDDGYVLTAAGVRFGSSFRELSNVSSPFPRLSYWIDTQGAPRWRVDLQLVTRDLQDFVMLASDMDVAVQASDVDDGSPMKPSIPEPPGPLLEQLQGIVHVPSARPSIRPVYELREPLSASVEEVPYWLCTKPALLEEVSKWMVEITGSRIALEKDAVGFRLTTERNNERVNMAVAGRGVQAALPVAALALASQMEEIPASLLIVEEPEAHLHPSAHAAIAELLANAASPNRQVLAETHSENLILRLRRKIASHSLRREDLSLVYVDEGHSPEALEVDQYGGVRDWPVGVFESDMEEAEAIVEARLAAIQGGSLASAAE